MTNAHTLIDVLAKHAEDKPAKTAYVYLADGEGDETSVAFGALNEKVPSIASILQTQCRAGDRVLLLYPFGLDYILGFLACLYAGVIAVPAYPPSGRGKTNY